MLKKFNLNINSNLEEPLLGLADVLGVTAFSSPQIADAVGKGETDFVYTGRVIVSFIASTLEQDTAAIQNAVKAWMLDSSVPADALSVDEYSDNQDWMAGFKEYFHPISVGDRVVVRPPWSEPLPHEVPERTILIDPGMAFGTGTHETTRLCLLLLDEMDVSGQTFLDVGAGSGILSFYLMKVNAKCGTAIEIEGAAVENMRKNAAINKISDQLQMICTDLSDFKPQSLVDGLVANITSPVIIENLELMSRWVKKGAWGVFSGVNEANAESVRKAFAANGWKLVKEITEADWHGFKLVRI